MLFEPDAATPAYALRKYGDTGFNAVFFCETPEYAKKLAQAYFDQHRVRLKIVKLSVLVGVVGEIS